MLSTPKIAPVGSPAALRRSGNAWKARYRYDDPSTSSSVFSKGTYERQDSEVFRHRLAGGERRRRSLASVPHYVRIRRGHLLLDSPRKGFQQMSRRFLATVLLAVVLPAWSQLPPKLEPLHDMPLLPPLVAFEHLLMPAKHCVLSKSR